MPSDPDQVAGVVAALEDRIAGTVRTDPITRTLYATDASPYQILPAAVVVAREPDDIAAVIDTCRAHGLPITARGAGTSLSGQCVGAGLALDCSHLNRIEHIEPDRRVARVQPGVTWWQLNEALRDHGLEFGPDPATKRQCTIGGMVATNAGGTHSVVYGASVDHVAAAKCVLPDGRVLSLKASPDGSMSSAGATPELAIALEGVRSQARPMLGPQFSTLARRGSGYQMEHLCAPSPNLAKLLAGSDGTLALMTSVEVTLDERPDVRVLGVAGFRDMHAAVAAVPALVATGPSAVELVSSSLIDMARQVPFHAATVRDIDPSMGSLLYVEYQGSTLAETEAGLDRMDRALDSTGGADYRARLVDPVACTRMWNVREAGVGALSAVAGGPLLPQAFVEDTVVAVDRLPGYIRELDALFARHGMRVVWYGHAGTGLIHTRPFLDMTSARDLQRLESLMAEAVDLIRAWGGDLGGEHGDGLARSYWNERLFGPQMYAQMRAVKSAFDPLNLLN
ncbi:MAG TPA: FAD-binding oxidoreductase, partial [Actinomycetota bacterium]|nr:FAD-binding oxidoreductase [Actinomycetota bacterium]